MVKDGIVLGKRYEVLSKIGAGGMADNRRVRLYGQNTDDSWS